MTSWREERRPVATVPRTTVPELHARWEREPPQVLDVRERSEWDAGRIPGSVHRPYHDLDGVPEGIDPEQPVAVICASGQRAAVGASLLRRHGAEHAIHVVDGGVPQWVRSGWPVERA
jgi:hydroxyacylglutathione hydrolase